MRTLATGLALILAAATAPAGELGSAAPNTWVEVVKGTNGGGRLAPIFFYDPAAKRVVRAAGSGQVFYDAPSYDRYDTEELDLAFTGWRNAYPPGKEAGRPASGAVPGYNVAKGGYLFGLDGEQVRIKNRAVFHQWTYVPDRRMLYLTYGGGALATYDPEKRVWTELKPNVQKYKGGAQWCSLAYDPVNQELVQVGGRGGEDGTWVCSLQGSNEWRKLECGSVALKALGTTAADLRWRATVLLGSVVNRFTVAETEAEVKADLAAEGKDLGAALRKLGDEAGAANVDGNEKAGIARGRELIKESVDKCEGFAGRLAGKIDAGLIGELRATRYLLDRVCDALAAEPPQRGLSQAVLDPEHQKIVVFGGDRLDRVLSDTWLYDCKTRRWEQRFPKKAPAPRAGHMLLWLPEAKRVFLASGYSRVYIPQDMWSYDVVKNEWSFLGVVPLVTGQYDRKYSPGAPNADMNGYPAMGAAVPGDLVVAAGVSYGGAMACKVDVSKADPAGTEANGVAAGTYTIHPMDPARWEKAAKPDPDATMKFLKELPANEWHAFKFPVPCVGGMDWGETSYDPERHQFLAFGGGHATKKENEVNHFSIRGSVWTISYPVDAPINSSGYSTWFGRGFAWRPQFPYGHVYHGLAYDPAGFLFMGDNTYDIRAREWREPFPGGAAGPGGGYPPAWTTPLGVVIWPIKFDAKAKRWEKLPWAGPEPSGFAMDYGAMVHDSKRDCLWALGDKVIRYDFKTGKAEQVQTPVAPRCEYYGGKYYVHREAVYVPEADLILTPMNAKAKGGGAGLMAWDPANQKYRVVEIPLNKDGKLQPIAFTPNESGIAYDCEFKLIFVCDNRQCGVWALRLDPKTAKLSEIAE